MFENIWKTKSLAYLDGFLCGIMAAGTYFVYKHSIERAAMRENFAAALNRKDDVDDAWADVQELRINSK